MKISVILMLVLLQISMGLKMNNRGKSGVHMRTRTHMRNRSHAHNKHRNFQKMRNRQDPPKAAIDGPNDAVDNSKKILDAQKLDPVLSKAASGLYPFYPKSFNISAEDEPVIMFTQDTNAKGESLMNRHDLDYDEKCVLKQGYLAQVLSVAPNYQFIRNETGTSKVGQTFITMRPVFAVLNKQTLSIFENENVKGLLYSIPLTKVPSSCLYMKWKSTFCWSVVEGTNTIPFQTQYNGDDLPTVYVQPTPQGVTPQAGISYRGNIKLTLCATLPSARDNWANSINTFHNCEVKQVTAVEESKADFMRTIKDQDEDYEQERENASDEQILEIGNSLDSINDKVRANLNIITSTESKDDQQINDEDGQIDALENRNECLQEQLIQESVQSAQNLQWDLEKAMTDQIKKAVDPNKLDDLYKNRLYRIIQHKQNQIKQRKRIENNINQEMMYKVQQVTKNADAGSCYGAGLSSANLNDHIKKVCTSIYKDAGYTLILKDLMDCLNENTFCMACCSNFIGTSKMDKRNECVDKCYNMKKDLLAKTQLVLKAETKNSLSKNSLVVDDKVIEKLQKQQ